MITPPFFKLFGIKWNQSANWPSFKDTARQGKCPDNGGITAYYSNSCPFTEYWNEVQLRHYADIKGVPVTIHHINTREEAQQMPIPWIINSIFYKGELVTLEVKPDRHLDKLI